MKNLGAVGFPLAVAVFALLVFLPARADEFPPGLYKDNSKPIPFGGGCQPAKMDHGTLTASCPNYFGVKKDTSLADADKCAADKHDIENIDGHLRCVISSQKIGGSHPYTADIISILSDVKANTNCLGKCPPNQETIVTRIDQPRVDIMTSQYKSIKFQPGDTVMLTGGGCVTGAAVRRPYVHPKGLGSDQDYSATAYIDGVTSVFENLAELINKTLPIPTPSNPVLTRDLFPQLGYVYPDALLGPPGDNGYWGQDNGLDNQCKDIGPAWVEVTVVRQIRGGIPSGVAWSPHSRPFDLVWDVNNEDYNGLPLNPQWAYQLDHPSSAGYPLPDFGTLCGGAFYNAQGMIAQSNSGSGNNAVHADTLARDCTSEPTIFDVSNSSLVGDWTLAHIAGQPTPYCTSGPNGFNGHLNWMIATYTGWINWLDWSGDPDLIQNGDLADGDYNLVLSGPNTYAGETTNEIGLGLEFNDDETVNRANSTWWQQLRTITDLSGNSQTMFDSSPNNDTGGFLGVVTGEIGIDGVHGGYAESHPVFALALQTNLVQVNNNTVQQDWVFFLHNVGNGGGCSEDYYTWTSQIGGGRVYYIQMPWWGDATDVKLLVGGQFWGWQEGTNVSLVSSPGTSTLIKVQFPPFTGQDQGIDGQFVLQYTTPSTQVHQLKSPGAAPGKKEKEREDNFKLTAVSSRIADPVVRAKYTADAQQALKAFSVRPAVKKFAISVDTEIKVEPRTPGAASRGEGTPAKTSTNVAKKQLNAAINKLMETYRPQMEAAPPTKK